MASTDENARDTSDKTSAPGPTATPEPKVEIIDVQTIEDDFQIIPNRNVDMVPNVGVIGGSRAVLVIDSGMGPINGRTVLAYARQQAAGRRIYLTTTHFHPEHAFGADVFAQEATYLVNRAQADDLRVKGPGCITMFQGLGESVAKYLQDVVLPTPDVVYGGTLTLDLGGRTVDLCPTGQGHTKGDQVIWVPDARALFTGDLVETCQFSIFPWFPPQDDDVRGVGWINSMERLIAMQPQIVVPGHGDTGGPERLTTVLDYLQTLRDETWRRRNDKLDRDTTVTQVKELVIAQHPDWRGQEWIERGVDALCSEHVA